MRVVFAVAGVFDAQTGTVLLVAGFFGVAVDGKRGLLLIDFCCCSAALTLMLPVCDVTLSSPPLVTWLPMTSVSLRLTSFRLVSDFSSLAVLLW